MLRHKLTYTSLFTTALVLFLTADHVVAQGFFRDLFDHRSDGVQATFQQDWLFTSRDSRIDTGGTVVNGADAGRLGFHHLDFDYEDGYRLNLGVQNCEHRIEAVFANYGTWYSQSAGSLSTGLSFDDGIPANWPAGASSLGPTTFFTPMHIAATPALGGEGDEHEGLGPNSANGTDAVPTFTRRYQSEMQDVQINWLSNDPSADIRIGIGYRNVQLDETAGLQISGVFRAADVAGANGGLSHATLTGIAGLTFITNTPNGFDDESLLGNNGTPDTLIMDYSAETTNDLNGFQAIVDMCLINTPRAEVTLVGRAGAYHNHAKGIVRESFAGIGNDASIYRRTLRDSKDSVAFVGGVGIRTAFRLSEHWRLLASYDGTFLSGLALSPEQNSGIRGGVYQVNTDGHVIVHGGTVGAELTY